MATTDFELQCDKHHTPTQLRCAQCEKPACTKCLVWTEVGQKCRTCAPNRGRATSHNSVVVPALIAAALVFVLLGISGVFSSGSKPSAAVVPRLRTQPGIGQDARDGPLTFVVTKFTCGAKDVGADPLKKTALGRYCLLEVKAKNTGNQPTSFSSSSQSLLDGKHRRFVYDAEATRIYQRSAPTGVSTFSQLLNPAAEIATSLIYDIPESVNPEFAELRAGNTTLAGVTVRLTEGAGLGQG